MREALALAVLPDAKCNPNPRVGCVLVGPGGEIVGRGHHVGAGLPHAEVNAIAVAGELARGATAVVTLEPCLHTGRTGPCTQALIEAGVSQVVFAQADPTDIAGGWAAAMRYRGANSRVTNTTGVCQSCKLEIRVRFSSHPPI